jgi:hypothetical protein
LTNVAFWPIGSTSSFQVANTVPNKTYELQGDTLTQVFKIFGAISTVVFAFQYHIVGPDIQV